MTSGFRIAALPYAADSAYLFERIADLPWAVLLDSGRHHPGQSRYDILAAEPIVTLQTRGLVTEVRTREGVALLPDDPLALLRRHLGTPVRQPCALPFWGGAIGYFAYDLARRPEWKLRLPARVGDAERLPEMAVGIYDWAVIVDHLEERTWLAGGAHDPETGRRWDDIAHRLLAPVPERRRAPFAVTAPAVSNLTEHEYAHAFRCIQDYIRAGDCYQVNLAQRFAAPAQGDPWLAYQALRVINPAPHAAYLSTPHAHILSASPERFLRADYGEVETRPIKGTRPRVGHARLDAELAEALRTSEKDRAENVMIVDLLRNDLSKVCEPHSVRVPRLFEVESFATVHHLVSTVTGRLRVGCDAIDLLRACFPGGSVTGAPKQRAMQVIDELEPHPRSTYCGAIGYLGYNGNMDTNIAIRTLVVSGGAVRLWAGGGIVADSKLEDEYQETFDKARGMLRVLEQAAVCGAGA